MYGPFFILLLLFDLASSTTTIQTSDITPTPLPASHLTANENLIVEKDTKLGRITLTETKRTSPSERYIMNVHRSGKGIPGQLSDPEMEWIREAPYQRYGRFLLDLEELRFTAPSDSIDITQRPKLLAYYHNGKEIKRDKSFKLRNLPVAVDGEDAWLYLFVKKLKDFPLPPATTTTNLHHQL